jgi:DNA polymerase (family 10)
MPDLDNVSIAARLELMADLLEISGADTYRLLSYRKAGGTIRAWPEQLTVMAEEGRLTEIPGVGAKLAERISSLIAEDTFPELEEVQRTFPASLAEVMQVQGVGPKRAAMLHEKLGIASVDDLDAALDRGELSGLPGLGAKSIGRIRNGVSAFLRHHERVLLMDALPTAEQIVEHVRSLAGVQRAEIAGSVRRGVEAVTEIRLVVLTEEPRAVSDRLATMSGIAEVTRQDEAGVAYLSTAGLPVEVTLTDPACFGNAWIRSTGNRSHVEKLGEIATASTEGEVYRAAGLAWIPPELREDLGEMEAARDARLPELIELSDIRGDLHAHTIATDAHSTIEENRAMAAELGYEYVGVTDHAFDLRMVGGLDQDALERQWDAIDELNAEGGGPVILKATELNIGAEGRVDYEEDVLSRFDYCIASLHDGWSESSEKITARMVAAMHNPLVDIIGHPTGRIIGRRDPLALDMDAVFAAAAETGTILELNSYPDRLDLKDEHLREARAAGVRFAIDTDAHRSEHMRYMRYGIVTARRGWLEAADAINTLEIEGLRAALKRNRSM